MEKEKRIKWRIKGDSCIHAFNNSGEHLGKLSYELVGRHKHFCWYQNTGIRMSPGCLQEVRDEQKNMLAGRNKFINNFIKEVWDKLNEVKPNSSQD